MDTKTKIRLLSDLQNVLDSGAIRDAISQEPSGNYIWQKIEQALQADMELLLSSSDTNAAANAKAEKILSTLEEIGNSKVLDLLVTLNNRISTGSSAPASRPPTSPVSIPTPQFAGPGTPTAVPPSLHPTANPDGNPEVRFEDHARESFRTGQNTNKNRGGLNRF